MGKYGIGVRVSDPDGDEGVIIDKRKGERLVRYDAERELPDIWWLKSDLAVVEPKKPLKVGDRVIAHGRAWGDTDDVGTVFSVVDGGVNVAFDDGWTDGHGGGGIDGATNRWFFGNEDVKPFAIEAGKFYRTRDGKRVGPMEADSRGFFHGGGGKFSHYATNGISAFRGELPAEAGRTDCDIVAFWTDEPVVVVESAPATLTLKPGDKVKLRNGVIAEIIEVDDPTTNTYPFAHDSGKDRYHATTPAGESCLGDDDMDIVAVLPTPKFKVGDIVNYTLTDTAWQGVKIIEVILGEVVEYRGVSTNGAEGRFIEDWIELAPATDLVIGNAVTATGYISGANGNNFSVVFGDRSYDLPATLLKKAA